jgi:hypothetical protein
MNLRVPFHQKYGGVLSRMILFSSLVMLSLDNVRLRLRLEHFEETKTRRLDELQKELQSLQSTAKQETEIPKKKAFWGL